MEKGTTQRKFFKNLDALRFLAFLFIFLGHGLFTESSTVENSSVYGWMSGVIMILGKTGFSFAFVLSGFINTWVILEEKKLYGTFTPWKYYVRRALRIWPLYFLVLLIGFVLIPVGAQLFGVDYHETGNPLYFIFFIGNFYLIEHGWTHSPILSVLWSVSVEEQFYLVWPFLLLIFWKRRLALIAGMMAIFVFTTYTYYLTEVNLWFHSLFLLADIIAGALFAFIAFQRNWGFDKLTNVPRWLNGSLYLAFGLILVFYHDLFDRQLLPGALNLIIEKLVVTLFLAYFIFEQCFGNNRLLNFGTFKWLSHFGMISYGLFCFHEIGLVSAHQVLELSGLKDDLIGQLLLKPILAFAVIWPMAELSWRYFEKPFLRLKRKFYG